MNKIKNLQIFAWSLAGLVCMTTLLVWSSLIQWNFTNVDGYRLFPLFGLLAFSLMWSHYIVGAVREIFNVDKKYLKNYFDTTSWAVLGSILMHPILFNYQLIVDGFGLPPSSYVEYYGQALAKFVLLGALSLVAFLIFELRFKYSNRSWWKYVVYANDLAMIGIFIHGIKLGTVINSSLFKYVWYFYGVSLLIAILYLRFLKKYSSNDSNEEK